MTRQPLSVAFHVGAHKTATTHLQECLRRAVAPMAAEGVRYYGPEHFRLPAQTIPELFGFEPAVTPDPSRRSPQEQLAALVQDAHRLVISEENFIGTPNSVYGRGLRKRYKLAGEKLGQFARAVGQPINVFLAIRRPTGYMNSAYCQMLLSGVVLPPNLYIRRNPLSSLDWFELVTRIRKTSGVGQITVWPYEDYAVLFPRIVSALLGEAAARHVPVIQRPINVGFSAAAVAEVLHRSAHDPLASVANIARGLLPVDEGYPPFDAFTPEEHAISDARYAAQRQAIATMDGVTFLQPD